jgi:hypothetical protein
MVHFSINLMFICWKAASWDIAEGWGIWFLSLLAIEVVELVVELVVCWRVDDYRIMTLMVLLCVLSLVWRDGLIGRSWDILHPLHISRVCHLLRSMGVRRNTLVAHKNTVGLLVWVGLRLWLVGERRKRVVQTLPVLMGHLLTAEQGFLEQRFGIWNLSWLLLVGMVDVLS